MAIWQFRSPDHASIVTRRPLRVTWLFYPCLIVFSIIATANHFWLDAILGGLLAAVALSAAWLIERYRPTLPRSARIRMRLEPRRRLAGAR